MAVTRSTKRSNWSELPQEILVLIFTMVNVLDRVINIAAVCHSWRSAASDKSLSNTLDISEFRKHTKPGDQNRIKVELEFAFARGINFYGLNLAKLVFDAAFRVNSKHWLYASQRCQNLRELVLPIADGTTKPRLKRVFQSWPHLQSLHIAFRSTLPPTSIFNNAGIHCPNLRVLKVSCSAPTTLNVKTIIKQMPGLKVLSIRCITITRNDLRKLLSSLPNLEGFYISLLKTYNVGFLLGFQFLQFGVVDARRLSSFSNIQVFHACYWE